jgi:hypothetical protein
MIEEEMAKELELDQIVTFGPGVKAYRIVVDRPDVTTDKLEDRIVRTENAEQLGKQLRADIARLYVVNE